MSHGWMKTVDAGKPGNKKRLENIQLLLGRAAFEKAFASLSGGMTPEVFEWGVASRKLVGGHTEEDLSSAWEELRAHRTCRLRYVSNVVRAAGPTDDCVANLLLGAIVDIVE
jgi:hypothetical protein